MSSDKDFIKVGTALSIGQLWDSGYTLEVIAEASLMNVEQVKQNICLRDGFSGTETGHLDIQNERRKTDGQPDISNFS